METCFWKIFKKFRKKFKIKKAYVEDSIKSICGFWKKIKLKKMDSNIYVNVENKLGKYWIWKFGEKTKETQLKKLQNCSFNMYW